jgi:hypothetical protein
MIQTVKIYGVNGGKTHRNIIHWLVLRILFAVRIYITINMTLMLNNRTCFKTAKDVTAADAFIFIIFFFQKIVRNKSIIFRIFNKNTKSYRARNVFN